MPQELAPGVLSFLTEHIRDVEALQVLILLVDSADRWWDPSGLSRELGIAPPAARRLLDYFARANLLDIRVTGDVRYRFKPGTDELHTVVREFAEAFHANPMPVMQQLTAGSKRGLRDFADAFRIRRDDDR